MTGRRLYVGHSLGGFYRGTGGTKHRFGIKGIRPFHPKCDFGWRVPGSDISDIVIIDGLIQASGIIKVEFTKCVIKSDLCAVGSWGRRQSALPLKTILKHDISVQK